MFHNICRLRRKHSDRWLHSKRIEIEQSEWKSIEKNLSDAYTRVFRRYRSQGFDELSFGGPGRIFGVAQVEPPVQETEAEQTS